jgi:hypothetical protein
VPEDDPEEQLEHDAKELDERIDRVETHIGESRGKLKDRQEDAADWDDETADDSEEDEAGGENPAGFDDPEGLDELDVKEEE